MNRRFPSPPDALLFLYFSPPFCEYSLHTDTRRLQDTAVCKEEGFMACRSLRLAAVVVACLVAAAPAFAQGGGASTTGTISGKVSDSSGAVLPGVTVTATSAPM